MGMPVLTSQDAGGVSGGSIVPGARRPNGSALPPPRVLPFVVTYIYHLLAQDFKILCVRDYSEAPRGSFRPSPSILKAPGGAGAGDFWWAFGKAFDIDIDYR